MEAPEVVDAEQKQAEELRGVCADALGVWASDIRERRKNYGEHVLAALQAINAHPSLICRVLGLGPREWEESGSTYDYYARTVVRERENLNVAWVSRVKSAATQYMLANARGVYTHFTPR